MGSEKSNFSGNVLFKVPGRRLKDDGRPPGRMRSQHAVIPQRVGARSRNERRQAFEQIERMEEQVRPAVGPRAPEASSCAPSEEVIKAVDEAL